jgi:predicted DNA-binding transcriptional regulator YafY
LDIAEDMQMRIRNIYYNPEFSENEVRTIVEGLEMLASIDSQDTDRLVSKAYAQLGPEIAKEEKIPVGILKEKRKDLLDSTQLKDNICQLQKAIDDQVQIELYFNGYYPNKHLMHVRKMKDRLSPYKLLVYKGGYYLLACNERFEKKQMSIWRVDLMTDIQRPQKNKKDLAATDRQKVKNLPSEEVFKTQAFQTSHIYMSYDRPVMITLKIYPDEKGNVNCTFLHDWFGDQFELLSERKSGEAEVLVKCSPYGIVHWALSYSDRCEVVGPQQLRDLIKDRIQKMNDIYSNEGRIE